MKEDDYERALERLRWPEGPFCPRCHAKEGLTELGGSSPLSGLLFCTACKRPFSLKAQTPLASSKLPARAWIQAAYMLTADKPTSVQDVAQTLGVTESTGWHVVMRLLGCVAAHKGPLPVFGEAVKANIPPLARKHQRKLAAWGERQAKKRAEAKPLRTPVATGALSRLKFSPRPTKAHLQRTEHFLSWVMATPL